MGEHICCKCARSNGVLFNFVFNKYICSICIQKHEYKRCNDCGSWLSKSQQKKVGTAILCDDCIDSVIRCDWCNKPSVELLDTAKDCFSDWSESICKDCFKKSHPCKDCGIRIKGKKDYCDECAPLHKIKKCIKCHKKFDSQTGVDSIIYEPSDYRDDEKELKNVVMCKKCYDQYDKKYVDHSHSHSFPYKMKGSSKIFFGVELEFELYHCKELDAIMKIDFSKGDRFVKDDGSLDHGIELVSMPCSLNYHKNFFHWDTLCKDLTKLGCKPDHNCGLHIHMSRKFTEEEEKKLYWFIYKHVDIISKVAGRGHGHYREIPYGRDYHTGLDIITPSDQGFSCRSNSRYYLLNFDNRKTIEFRLPAGTFDHKRIYANLEFLDAVINYTKRNSLTFIKTTPWESFIDWIKSSKEKQTRYINLINFYDPKAKIIVSTPKQTKRYRRV